jgi:hypothetical protein
MVEREATVKHLKALRAAGVPYTQIAARTNIPLNTIYNLNHKAAKRPGMIHRFYAERILAIEIPKDHTPQTEQQKQRIVGTGRILRGLNYRGWPLGYVAKEVGTTEGNFKSFTSDHVTTKRGISDEMYAQLVQVAGKLESLDPTDHIEKRVVMCVMSKARAKGWYDISAWDMDTVHLPKSKPDETGQCGKVTGSLIHRREGTRVCPRCHEAEQCSDLDIDAFYAAVVSGQFDQNKHLARAFNISEQLSSKYAGVALGANRRDLWHILTEINEDTMRARCSRCNDYVQIYRSGNPNRRRLNVAYQCKNKVMEYRAQNGHNHGSGRMEKPTLPPGEPVIKQDRIALDADAIAYIRENYGRLSSTELAVKYDVSTSTIYRVVTGRDSYFR